jgi:hypothetical protein
VLGHAWHQGQAFRIECTQHLQLMGQQGGAAHVGNMAAEVAYAALGIQYTGFFLTGQSITKSFTAASSQKQKSQPAPVGAGWLLA